MVDKKNKTMTEPVGDARFQKVHNDPRFAKLSKKKNKLQIDQRFASVLKDEKFQSVQGKYDKYGRRIEKKSNELKKFYRLDEDEKSGSSDNEDVDKNSIQNEEEEQGDVKMSRLEYLNRMARGEVGTASDTSESESDDEDVEEDEEYELDEKEDIPLGEETSRFAVMNCDWTRIRAVDIFALCQSFAPSTGTIKDVTIYPSDFGLTKMKEEEEHGPRQLWTEGDKTVGTSKGDSVEKSDENESLDEEEEEYDSDDPLGVRRSVSAKDQDGFDPRKLRMYELQKLKYYYAVVTCDTVKTASVIYDQCDQLEYETSSNLLDLRYIPEDMTFSNTPKEKCTNVPEHYKPAIFATAALQNTDVKLTWEEDNDERLELLTRQSEWKNVNENDFSAYLASENSSSEDEEEKTSDSEPITRKKDAKVKKIKDRYRKMLLGSDAEDESEEENYDPISEDDEEETVSKLQKEMASMNEDGNMEMSFTPGASDILKNKRRKELEESLTPFERYTRDKKLEKNKKQHEKRKEQKQLEREQRELLKATKKQGKQGKVPEQLQALREAIDEDEVNNSDASGNRNFDMKQIALNEKVKKLKGKRKAKELKKIAKKSGLQEDFTFDATDARFGKLYDAGSHFQLDPTDPKFKKTEATQAIFQERRKRMDQPSTIQDTNNASEVKQPKHDLNVMVENLKRKASMKSTRTTPKPFKKPKY